MLFIIKNDKADCFFSAFGNDGHYNHLSLHLNETKKIMKENKYDDEFFFSQYSQMPRSVNGLKGAGEWHAFRRLFPVLKGKRLLDLGCGFGWHCRYAIEQGAVSAIGIDLSHNMIKGAVERNASPLIEYRCMAIEDYEFPADSFEVVVSSLAFHYLESFDDICKKVKRTLIQGGSFVFSVEHPVFTAYGTQDWIYDETGRPLYWPVDRYFSEGKRTANFLGEEVVKYHKTLTTYINGLIKNDFEITGLVEPEPDKTLFDVIPGMENELRRPMMLLVSARKK